MKKLSGVVLTTLTIFSGILYVGCGKSEAEEKTGDSSSGGDTVRVSTIEVDRKDFIQQGEYYGKLEGIKSAVVISYMGGRVDALHVKEGDYVKNGTHLGRIDADRIVSQYETALLSEKIAKENYEREKRHFEQGNASRVAADRARIQWLQAKSSLKEAEKARRGALCITPISGIVTSKFAELYDELSPGSPVFKVVRMNVMKVNIGIPESEIGKVSEGNRAEVTFSIFPEKKWDGKLTALSREVSDHDRSFQAEVQLTNSDNILKPGITARVKLHLNRLENVVMIPSGAILSQGNSRYVMVVGKDHKAVRKTVETGPSSERETLIRSGLDEGDVLITEGYQLVKNGTHVKVDN